MIETETESNLRIFVLRGSGNPSIERTFALTEEPVRIDDTADRTALLFWFAGPGTMVLTVHASGRSDRLIGPVANGITDRGPIHGSAGAIVRFYAGTRHFGVIFGGRGRRRKLSRRYLMWCWIFAIALALTLVIASIVTHQPGA